MRGCSPGTGTSSAEQLEVLKSRLPALNTAQPRIARAPGHRSGGAESLAGQSPGSPAASASLKGTTGARRTQPQRWPGTAGQGRHPRVSGGLARRVVPTWIPGSYRPVSLQLPSTALLPSCQLHATFIHFFVTMNQLTSIGARPRLARSCKQYTVMGCISSCDALSCLQAC